VPHSIGSCASVGICAALIAMPDCDAGSTAHAAHAANKMVAKLNILQPRIL